ncbi:hypothetical protein K1719_043296 [Acacia pycnantha]|nr:hypothetical protein K1719_043296 [Acacia pycnantha]
MVKRASSSFSVRPDLSLTDKLVFGVEEEIISYYSIGYSLLLAKVQEYNVDQIACTEKCDLNETLSTLQL